MKLKQKLISFILAGVLLLGAVPVMVNAQGQWAKENGKWYYNDNGAWKKGWAKIDDVWYYFNGNSEMHIGWLNDGGTWYYLSSDGSMVNYTTTIDDKTQRFSSEGVWLGEVSYSNQSSSNSSSENAIVWRANSSTKYYHSSPNCSNMKSPTKMTLKEALNKNLEACPKCHKH